MKKTKILFILPTLTPGGAERVISFISQNIDLEKFNSTLLITGHQNEAAYKIEKIPVVFLEKPRVLNAIPALFTFILKYRPKIVFSSISHLNTVLGLMSPLFFRTKFYIREASVVSFYNEFGSSHKNNNIFHGLLPHLSYKLVNGIVCQSQDMANDFINVFNINKDKVITINNPITQNFTVIDKNEVVTKENNLIKYITVGRLSTEKGHIRILKILAQLKFNFEYTIIGDGPYKKKIFETITQLNLNSKIKYIPFTSEVLNYIAENDMFLQGSYVEGFPNASLESCIVGTPVLAFNVPGGTKEIIEHNINGYLVETENEYLSFLNRPLSFNRKKVSDSVYSKFNKEKIIKQYEDLFNGK